MLAQANALASLLCTRALFKLFCASCSAQLTLRMCVVPRHSGRPSSAWFFCWLPQPKTLICKYGPGNNNCSSSRLPFQANGGNETLLKQIEEFESRLGICPQERELQNLQANQRAPPWSGKEHNTRTYIYVYFLYVYTYTHTRTYVYIHIHIYIYTHIL